MKFYLYCLTLWLTLLVGPLTAAVPHNDDPSFDLPPDPNHLTIIILASFRGGSTFVGQLFDQNPSVQYLFEPFHEGDLTSRAWEGRILGHRPRHTMRESQLLYLQQLLHNCTVYPGSFRPVWERCGSEEENLERLGTTSCNPAVKPGGHTWLGEMCRRRGVSVIKVIRLRELRHLLQIHRFKEGKIRIIHLVRHPIPMIMSRTTSGAFFSHLGINADKTVQWWKNGGSVMSRDQQRVLVQVEAERFCADSLAIQRQVAADAWFADRYMLLRHEDVSEEPVAWARRVYRWVNLTIPEELPAYLERISHGPEEAGGGGLEVNKDSRTVMEKWLHIASSNMVIKMQGVMEVERVCAKYLRQFGYHFYMDRDG